MKQKTQVKTCVFCCLNDANRTFSREFPIPLKGTPWCRHQRKCEHFPESVGNKLPRSNRCVHRTSVRSPKSKIPKPNNVRFRDLLVTRTGLEPMLPPWKGGVLTAWPTGHYSTCFRSISSFLWNVNHLLSLFVDFFCWFIILLKNPFQGALCP